MKELRLASREAHAALRESRRVLVACHRRPDGDALGSATAIVNWLIGDGSREVVGFCSDPVPDQMAFLEGSDRFVTDGAVFERDDWDVIVVCDTSDLAHAGLDGRLAAMPRRPRLICFDHHHTNSGYGDINVIDAAASSASEVVYRFLKSIGADIDRHIATSLVTGIFTDTDGFTNAATSDAALDAAAELMRRGGEIGRIAGLFRRGKTVDALRLWGLVLSRLKRCERTGVASTAVFLDDPVDSPEQVEGLANFLNAYLDARVVLVLKEAADGKIKGSFRAADDTDVSAVAKSLGGGGHRKAAGFSVAGRIVECDDRWCVVRG